MANRSSNKAAVPEAKGALDKFKYEVATELGVPLTDGYNGDLTRKSCIPNFMESVSEFCIEYSTLGNRIDISMGQIYNERETKKNLRKI